MFSDKAADKAVFFIERFLKLSTGRWAGQPVKLMDWQKDEIIRPLFGTLKEDGTRQYRTCYVEIPRKNTKTETGAMIGNFLLFADEEPGAHIYSAAGDRFQAGLIYQAAAPMVRQSPELLERAKIRDSQKRIIVPNTNSFYQVLSAESYTKHGINAHGVLFDELHTQPNRDLWDVLTTSQGTRQQPLIYVMTTAGYDRNSIAFEIHDYALKVLNGVIDDPTFLAVIYAAPDDADWKDEEMWRACNPAMDYGVRDIEEMRGMCRRAQETPALEQTFRRLYLNQWTTSVERWMPLEKWDACEAEFPDLENRTCYAGLDLSATVDLTAMSLVFPVDEEFFVLPFFWIPEDTMREKERRDKVPYSTWLTQGHMFVTPGNVVDYDFIFQFILDLSHKYNIQEIGYDPWNATPLVLKLQDEGFNLVEMRQGTKTMSPPTKELERLVYSNMFHHDGNPVLRWNIDNLVVKSNATGDIKPDKEKATQKIDGAVAMIMGLDRAIRNTGSVYDSRGVLSFEF